MQSSTGNAHFKHCSMKAIRAYWSNLFTSKFTVIERISDVGLEMQQLQRPLFPDQCKVMQISQRLICIYIYHRYFVLTSRFLDKTANDWRSVNCQTTADLKAKFVGYKYLTRHGRCVFDICMELPAGDLFRRQLIQVLKAQQCVDSPVQVFFVRKSVVNLGGQRAQKIYDATNFTRYTLCLKNVNPRPDKLQPCTSSVIRNWSLASLTAGRVSAIKWRLTGSFCMCY